METELVQVGWIWADFLSPIAILISALGAWWFAAAAIKNARDIANKKSTFDYLSKLSWDRDYIKAKNKFLEIRLGTKKLRAVSEEYHRLKSQGQIPNGNQGDRDEATHDLIEEYSAIKNILNEYEALAIAVRSGALDEGMVKSNIRQQFIDHIESCKEFITHTRRNSGVPEPNKIWCEIQDLVDK
ncbi:protein of unknown function [Roseovarius lutimaris]|uniref:DUF4760 domain-containing protein n=1 Tax=Roseovarius lutimaris TaxID=1005928 RepID=A0A1I5H6A7_9RHOB|nr:DUF4760 domain-containing protein [Roseovarius lutimaris]SFO43848.1 protein of unknown function [Roseovarius lutimaris]